MARPAHSFDTRAHARRLELRLCVRLREHPSIAPTRPAVTPSTKLLRHSRIWAMISGARRTKGGRGGERRRCGSETRGGARMAKERASREANLRRDSAHVTTPLQLITWQGRHTRVLVFEHTEVEKLEVVVEDKGRRRIRPRELFLRPHRLSGF